MEIFQDFHATAELLNWGSVFDLDENYQNLSIIAGFNYRRHNGKDKQVF